MKTSFVLLPFLVVNANMLPAALDTEKALRRQQHRARQSGTCGGGNRGDGICSDGTCCSEFGWCGTSPEHCSSTGTGDVSGTCGGGNQGNGICTDGTCCSEYGWCGTSPEHCSGTGSGGESGTSGGGGCDAGWMPASWTTYTSYAPCCEDSPNYDPNADTTECYLYSACDYSGDFAYIGHKAFEWVQSNNIVSFFSTDNNASFGNKRIRFSARGTIVEALVADTCGDDDCNGCCTVNSEPSGYLVDMEYWTVVNNFGNSSVASGQICWQLV